jgi:cytochrome P450
VPLGCGEPKILELAKVDNPRPDILTYRLNVNQDTQRKASGYVAYWPFEEDVAVTAVKNHPDEAAARCPIDFTTLNGLPSPPLAHFARFDELREECDIHEGDASGNRFWFVARMADQLATFQNPSVFSNRAVVPDQPDPAYMWIPEMVDPPLHTKWRKLLGPLFAPGAVAAMEIKIRGLFNDLLDGVEGRGGCDIVQDVALKFPNTIFMELMGLPVADADQFQVWETKILHTQLEDPAGQTNAMNEVIGYFTVLIADRRANPREDILSTMLSWKIDDVPISDEDLLAFCLLLFMAGLDTVASQLAYSFLHLAQNPDDRERIVADPGLIPSAIEEFLRYYAFVTPGRKVIQDTEIAGQHIKVGDMVLLPLASANRDPAEFPDADKVLIDRTHNRHLAFGSGPHRCLGSHLARVELRVAMEEWHKRIPSYALTPDIPIIEHGGQIGLVNLPITWKTL